MVGNHLGWTDGRTAVDAFAQAVKAKLQALGMETHPWARYLVDRAMLELRTVAEAPLQPSHKTFFSGYYRGDELVTLLGSRGDAKMELDDVAIRVLEYPGRRRIEVGASAAEYSLGRRRGDAGEPYVKTLLPAPSRADKAGQTATGFSTER